MTYSVSTLGANIIRLLEKSVSIIKNALGQYLYINPSNEIIIVRLGEKGDVNYERIFNQIIKQIENEN